MIGQKNLITGIDNLIHNKRFPRFSIICGVSGSGKKELCRHIAEELDVFWCYEPDCKVETVRNAIWDSYKVYSPTMYAFADADNMSIQAKNSLLKVTEEPPHNAYFIITLENINNMLPTIRSRAIIFNMQDYSVPELLQYAKEKGIEKQDYPIITDICETPGEVNYVNTVGINKFYDYVKKVFDNIAVVNGANAFKIASNLCLKENTTGYDLKLFLKAFKQLCWKQYLQDKKEEYLNAIKITTDAINKCNYKSINKQMVFDMWLLSIREEWIWK